MSKKNKHKPSSPTIESYLRKLALPVGVSVAGLGITTLGIFLLVKNLRRVVDYDDADVENYDVVRNKPLFI